MTTEGQCPKCFIHNGGHMYWCPVHQQQEIAALRELATQVEGLRPRARDLARRLREHGGARELEIAAELERFAKLGEMPAGRDDG